MDNRVRQVWFVVLGAVLGIASGPTSADLMDGLVVHYPFNGSADDASGNGNHGIVHGASAAPDRFGNPDGAYGFDGMDDYIDVGSGIKPPFPVTVAAWITVEDPLRWGTVFRNDHMDSSAYRYGLALISLSQGGVPGYLGCHVFEGFSAGRNRQTVVSNDPVVADNQWHHFAVVFRDHIDMRIYWDAVPLATHHDPSGTGSGMIYSSSGHGAIGMENVGAGVNWHKGCVDDVWVFGRALSDAEVVDLMNVPEPATLALLALGGLAMIRRRK